MRRMVHYNQNGFIRGSTRIYDEGEEEMSSLISYLLGAGCALIILKISGLNLSSIFSILNSFTNYIR